MLDRKTYMRKFGNPSAMAVNTNIKITDGIRKKKSRSRQRGEFFSQNMGDSGSAVEPHDIQGEQQ